MTHSIDSQNVNTKQIIRVLSRTLQLSIVVSIFAALFAAFSLDAHPVIAIGAFISTGIYLILHFVLVRKQAYTIVAWVLLLFFWLVNTAAILTYGMQTSVIYFGGYLLSIVTAFIVLGTRGGAIFLMASVTVSVYQLIGIHSDLFNELPLQVGTQLIENRALEALVFFEFLLLLYLSVRSLLITLEQLQANTAQLTAANRALTKIQTTLQDEIAARTADLREREARNRALIEALPDVLMRIDRDGIYHDFHVPLDFPQREQVDLDRIGRSLFDFFPAQVAQERLDKLLDTLSAETRTQDRYVHPQTGNVLETRLSKINQNEVMGIVRDVTAQHRAEEELRESEARNRALIEALPDVVGRLRRDGVYLDFRVPREFALMENDDYDRVGRQLREFMSDAVAQKVESHIQHVLDTGQPVRFEYQRAEHQRHFQVRLVATGSDEVTFTVRDITEQKLAEQQQQQDLIRLQQIISAIPGAVFVFSEESGSPLWTNEEAGRLPLDAVSHAAAPSFPLLHMLADADERQQISTAWQSDEAIKAQTVRLQFVDKRPFWARLSIFKMVYDRQLARLVIIEDIDDYKRAEETMLQAQKIESLGLLAGGIAHDFNNLLTSVMTQNSLSLYKLPDDHQARRHIEKAMRSTERAAGLTHQLLAYSGRSSPNVQKIDLNELINDNLHLLEASVTKSIQVQTQLQTGLSPVKADVNQMQQVVMNLLLNAAQAIGEHQTGQIEISSDEFTISEAMRAAWPLPGITPQPGRYVRMQVSDNGSGMSPETLHQIFDPFFTTKDMGRGLGLSAVLGIVKGHNGGIQVQSRLNEGTTFTIYLPAVAAPAAEPPETAVAPPNSAHGCVLVIDDESYIREAVSDILAFADITVLTAASGPAGIELLQQQPEAIDLVLLDLSMPEMSGSETLRHLRALRPNLKVLLCSGYSKQEIAPHFVDGELTGFLAKPFDMDTLLQTVEAYLASDPQPTPPVDGTLPRTSDSDNQPAPFPAESVE